MRDITHKPDSLRTAIATARLNAPAACIAVLRERRLEKGDALEAAKAAGYLAAKRTFELIPLCHPLPVQDVSIDYRFDEAAVHIDVEVKTVYGTGVEMEALTAAAITALTLYDMLKPVAGMELSIDQLHLLKKIGGKSQFRRSLSPAATAVLLVTSESSVEAAKREATGQWLRTQLQAAGIHAELHTASGNDLNPALQTALAGEPELLLTLGGTGITPADLTVEAVRPLITVEMPGIMEAARQHGQRRTAYAMISRGIAGLAGNTLVVTFPGSRRGAEETLDALLPGLVHTLEVMRATRK